LTYVKKNKKTDFMLPDLAQPDRIATTVPASRHSPVLKKSDAISERQFAVDFFILLCFQRGSATLIKA
jgi:hypothetical protein